MRTLSSLFQPCSGPNRFRSCLKALLLLALVLRLMGAKWGLPLVYHPDEPGYVATVLGMLQTGDFNPHRFDYPSLFLYLLLPFAIIVFTQGVIDGTFIKISDMTAAHMLTTGTGTTMIPELYLLGLMEMVVCGLITVYLIYRLGSELFGAKGGFWAALFLSILPIHIMASYWYRPDALVTLFVVASLYSATKVYVYGLWGAYITAGLLAGLAASSQYNGLIVITSLWIAHFLRRGTLTDIRLWFGTAAMVVGFLIGTPFALLDVPNWLNGLAWQLRHYYVLGHAGAESYGMIAQARWYLGKMFTTTGMMPLFALAGIAKSIRERHRTILIVIAFLVAYSILIIRPRVHTMMALTPMLPFIALLAACGFLSLEQILPQGNMRGIIIKSFALLLALSVWPQTLFTLHMFTCPEVRTVAREWIQNNLPAGARIAAEGYTPVLTDNFNVTYVNRLIDYPPEWYIENHFDYLVASSATYGRYYINADNYYGEVSEYNAFFNSFTLIGEIKGPFQFMADPKGIIRVYQLYQSDD